MGDGKPVRCRLPFVPASPCPCCQRQWSCPESICPTGWEWWFATSSAWQRRRRRRGEAHQGRRGRRAAEPKGCHCWRRLREACLRDDEAGRQRQREAGDRGGSESGSRSGDGLATSPRPCLRWRRRRAGGGHGWRCGGDRRLGATCRGHLGGGRRGAGARRRTRCGGGAAGVAREADAGGEGDDGGGHYRCAGGGGGHGLGHGASRCPSWRRRCWMEPQRLGLHLEQGRGWSRHHCSRRRRRR